MTKPGKRRPRLTEADLETIAILHPKLGCWLTAARIGRSASSVQVAASRLRTMARVSYHSTRTVTLDLYAVGPKGLAWTRRRQLQRLIGDGAPDPPSNRRRFEPWQRALIERVAQETGPVDLRQVGVLVGRTPDSVADHIARIVGCDALMVRVRASECGGALRVAA